MPRPIAVLSVGRSGTSLVARALNLAGLWLGQPERMMPATVHNPRGYWEHLDVYAINEELLQRLGGDWYRPPTTAAGWELDPSFDDLADRARALVDEFGSVGRWAFKDPRTVVTMPFWERIAGPCDVVVCIRSAEAMVRSIGAVGAEWVNETDSAQLWLDMNALVVERTIDRTRNFIFYEDWFPDARPVTNDLLDFVAATGTIPPHDASTRILEWFDPALRRADASADAQTEAQDPRPGLMLAELRRISAQTSTTADDVARVRSIALAAVAQ